MVRLGYRIMVLSGSPYIGNPSSARIEHPCGCHTEVEADLIHGFLDKLEHLVIRQVESRFREDGAILEINQFGTLRGDSSDVQDDACSEVPREEKKRGG